jgi:hypothetical protein
MTTETDNVVAAAPEKASRWEDFIDVIFSPGQVFDRRADESWTKPFLILAAVSVALYYLMLPVTGPMIEASMVENAPPNATAAQMQQSANMMKYVFGIIAPVMYLIMVAGTALAIKFVSALFDGHPSWRQSFVITTFAHYITIVQSLVIGIAAFIKSMMGGQASGTDASFGLLRFVDVGRDPVMRALLGRTDLFAIWIAVLFGVGLIHVAGMPKGKAFITAAIVWALIALPSLAMAALQS